MSKGTHIILDCYDVPRDVCLDDRRLLRAAVEAALAGGATVINTSRYRFGHNSPPGCTVFIMMDESHVSAHTYADDGEMAIDIFACGSTDAQAIADHLKAALEVKESKQRTIERF